MAANDDYVNSEGLNVKRKEHASEKKNPPTHTGTGSGSSITTTSTSKKAQHNTTTGTHEGGHGDNGENRQNCQGNTPKRPQHSYLLDSVAQVMIDTSKLQKKDETVATTKLNKSKHETNVLIGRRTPTRVSMFPANGDDDDDDDDDNDNDESVDSDKDDDPILNMIQTSNGRFIQKQEILVIGTSTSVNIGTTMQSGNPSKSKTKDPNRFLADLDARLSKRPTCEYQDEESQCPQQRQGQGQQSSQQQSPQGNLLQSFANTTHKMAWLRNVTTQDIQQSVSQLIPGMRHQPPATSSNVQYKPLQSSKTDPEYDSEDDDDEKVKIVQSSALIGDHENAELMKIRQKMNLDLLTMGLDIVEKNRYYVSIAVTFCVMLFGYILTKNKAADGAI